jgi:hypothetical protein
MSRELLEDVSDGDDSPLNEYRPVSRVAVVALALGLASAVAFLHPVLFIVPVVAVVTSLLALRQTSDPGNGLVGRGLGQVGLAMAIVLGGSGATFYFARLYFVAREAHAVSDQWFELLARGKPHMAHQLTVEPARRLPLNNRLWDFYRNNESLQASLRTFVEEPATRALLWLGPDATVRLLRTESLSSKRRNQTVTQIYSVTFPDDDKKGRKSFFVRVTLKRETDRDSGITGWRVISTSGPIRPAGWEPRDTLDAAQPRK